MFSFVFRLFVHVGFEVMSTLWCPSPLTLPTSIALSALLAFVFCSFFIRVVLSRLTIHAYELTGVCVAECYVTVVSSILIVLHTAVRGGHLV